jgi:carbonic anhydrase
VATRRRTSAHRLATFLQDVGSDIRTIVKAIQPALKKTVAAKKVSEKDGSKFVEAVADENIALVKANLTKQSKVLKHLVEEKKLKIVSAKYHIEDVQLVINY